MPLSHHFMILVFLLFFFNILFGLKRVSRYWFIIYIIVSITVGYIFAYEVFCWYTDEPEYTASFYATLLMGQNPYSTPVTLSYVRRDNYWAYLPLLGFIQIPYIGPLPLQPTNFYFLTIAVFVFLTVILLRGDTTKMCLFFNPITIAIIFHGYNDIVPVYFLMLGILSDNKIASYIGCAIKQFNFPIMTLIWMHRKEYKSIFMALLLIALVSLPFMLWDHDSFLQQAFLNHIHKTESIKGGSAIFPNYWLYPIALITVYYKRLGSILAQ